MLGNILSQTAWALIRLSKPRIKPRTLRHGARDQIFQAPPPPVFRWRSRVRGYQSSGRISIVVIFVNPIMGKAAALNVLE